MYRQHNTQALARMKAMTKYSSKFIAFAQAHMKDQGDEIKAWATSDNPLLAMTCKEIIEAAAG